MLVLKSLSFQNIGRFIEPQTIDFTSLGSLVQVDGQNNVTSGSSGSGKSTIFKALEFLLGLNDISNSVLQSRLTKSQMSVTGIFDFDGQLLTITRDKKLSIDLAGEITTGSSKIAEEKLDQIIGMDRDLFRKILVKRQGEQGFFLNLSPSETHKFLTNCLGLQKEQAKILTLDTRLSGLEKQEVVLKSSYESHQSALRATQNAISSIGPPPALEIDPDLITELEKLYTAHKESHSALKELHKKELADLESLRPIYTPIPFDRSAIEFIEGEIRKIQEKISQLNKVEEERQLGLKSKIADLRIEVARLENVELTRQKEVRSKAQELQTAISNIKNSEQCRQAEVHSRIHLNQLSQLKFQAEVVEGGKAKEAAISLAKELKKVRESLCPTCNQSWATEAAKTRESEILAILQDLKTKVCDGVAASQKMATLEEEYKELSLEATPRNPPEIGDLTLQIEQLKIQANPMAVPELDALHAQIDRLRIESQPQTVPGVVECKLEIDLKTSILNNLRKDESAHQFTESAKQQSMVVNHALKQTKLRESHEVAIHSARTKENQAFQDLQAAQNKVRNFEEAKLRFDESYGKLSNQLIQCRDKSDLTHKELLIIQEEIGLATEAKKVIKSYLSCSFEDALDSIGDAATRFIRNVPNMSTATIQFEGLKETKEGKVKEEITCSLSVDGELQVPIKSLSGGERSSTDLSIDLAVMEFIQERSGTGCNVLILDEPFCGLDSENISSIMEFLRESGTNKQILIVDHNPICKAMFESKVTVIRDGQFSKVVQK